ncbi:AzlD domain-containing protein [Herbiconiux sp. KACC 21604]|uniref:AzlD domain-containing protein n=1 Tax=unclassified Herbiconiux TaxID=2618217 RepID=UPI001491F869|nr:AzlD domain-containing protein [Herbiconiux sp. SALV-R1]QJU53705.1 AzlD domain-containing protein [Herbiconiux sp. SALV-R1]WPO84707.1 AzlD domain-containing protein [Herbiconiux sp. KACC 21604]
MSAWNIVLLASIICVGLKVAGYLIPAKAFEHPTIARIANLLTVALLAALIAVQTLGAGQSVQLDARVPAVAVAAVLYALRVPFVVVVIAAAAVAALLRAVF